MQEIKIKSITLETYKSMRHWCRDKFGQEAWWKQQLDNPNGSARWFANTRTSKDVWTESNGDAYFIFKDEKEATLFALQWAEHTNKNEI